MTIAQAIEELNKVSERTDINYVKVRLQCIIEDLTDYMNVQGEEYIINETIAKLIENKSSLLARVDRSWVKELYRYILSMSKTGQCESATIKNLDELSTLQERTLDECETTITGCLDYQNKKTSKKMAVFKYGVISLIFLAIVFTVLSLFEPFKDWGAIVGALIGAADFCFGLVFQIYERKDDMAQKSKTQAAQSKLQDKRKQINDKKQTIDVSVVNETHGDNSPIVSGDNNKFNY